MRETVKRLSLRLNGSEYAHLKVLAKGCGMKLEPTLRQLILGAELRSRPPDEIAALLRQLSAIGNNINQIAKVANASGFVRTEEIERIKSMQKMLLQAVKKL
mgnify:FL=1